MEIAYRIHSLPYCDEHWRLWPLVDWGRWIYWDTLERQAGNRQRCNGGISTWTCFLAFDYVSQHSLAMQTNLFRKRYIFREPTHNTTLLFVFSLLETNINPPSDLPSLRQIKKSSGCPTSGAASLLSIFGRMMREIIRPHSMHWATHRCHSWALRWKAKGTKKGQRCKRCGGERQ